MRADSEERAVVLLAKKLQRVRVIERQDFILSTQDFVVWLRQLALEAGEGRVG